jgi:hypothetical protein
VRTLFGLNGYLQEGYTTVIAVDRGLDPCEKNCDTKLAKVAREEGVRIIYRAPGLEDRYYGKENSHAELEGGGITPEEVWPPRPSLFDMLPKAPAEAPRPSGTGRVNSGRAGEVGVERSGPGGAARAAGAAGEALGPIGFLADIYYYAKYGPCAIPGMDMCRPHDPRWDA